MLKILVRQGKGLKYKWYCLVNTETNKYKYLTDDINAEGTFRVGKCFKSEYFDEINLEGLPEKCIKKLTNLEYMQLKAQNNCKQINILKSIYSVG